MLHKNGLRLEYKYFDLRYTSGERTNFFPVFVFFLLISRSSSEVLEFCYNVVNNCADDNDLKLTGA